jgi:predicted nucleic acid-binding protein
VIEASRGAELVSPDSLAFEIANALSARAKRQDLYRLDASAADAAFGAFQSMEIVLRPTSISDHRRALKLAVQQEIYAYDAYLLHAAQTQKAALLTLDGSGRRPGLRQIATRLGLTVLPAEP